MDAVNRILLSLQRKLYLDVNEEVLAFLLNNVADVLQGYSIICSETEKGFGKAGEDVSSFNQSCLQNFLFTKQLEGKSTGTLDRYRRVLTKLLDVLEDRSLSDVTAMELRAFLAEYAKRGCSNTTVNGIRKIICSFFNWLDGEGMIGKSPARKLSVIKNDTHPEPVLSEEEVSSIRDALPQVRDQAVVEFLHRTGCRVSELVQVNRGDIDFDRQEVLLHGKGGKDRVVPIDPKLRKYLLEYERSSLFLGVNLDAYFISRHTKARLTASGVRYVLHKAARTAGVEHVHPHRFRVTKITKLLQNGMKIEDVQVIAGHASIQTTVGYNRCDQERVWKEFIHFST